MKRAQVFKKTLLSVAVLSVIGSDMVFSQSPGASGGKPSETENQEGLAGLSDVVKDLGALQEKIKNIINKSQEAASAEEDRPPEVVESGRDVRETTDTETAMTMLAESEVRTVTESQLLNAEVGEITQLFLQDGTPVSDVKITKLQLAEKEQAIKVLDQLGASETFSLESKGEPTQSLRFAHDTLELSGVNSPDTQFIDVSKVSKAVGGSGIYGEYAIGGRETVLHHKAVGEGAALDTFKVKDGAKALFDPEGTGVHAKTIKVEEGHLSGAGDALTKIGGQGAESALIVEGIGSKVMADVQKVGKIHLKNGATLIADQIGSPDSMLDKLSMEGEVLITFMTENPPTGNGNTGNGGETQPTGNGNGTPPTGNGNGSSPNGNGGENQPTDNGNGTPPTGNGNGSSPNDNGGENQPTGNGNGTPPTGNGNGSSPTGNGNGTPPTGNGNENLPTGNGNENPPTGNGNENPPTGNGNENPPTGNGNQNPPTGNGNQNPPTGNGNQNPPANGSAGGDPAIYGSENLEVEIADKQKLIHSVKGFKTIKLAGGVLEGNLTGSSKDKSVVHLTSGQYRGGIIADVKDVTIDGEVQFKPESSSLEKATGKLDSWTALKAIDIQAPVKVTKEGNPVLYKSYGEATTMTSMTMENGAKATVMLDLSEDQKQRDMPHLTVGSLAIGGDNKIIGALAVDSKNPQAVYDVKKKLYDSKTKEAPITFTVLKADAVQGVEEADALTTVSADPLVEMKGEFDDEFTSYRITTGYPSDPVGALEKSGLHPNQAEVANALQAAALSVDDSAVIRAGGHDRAVIRAGGLSLGARMDQAIAKVGYQQAARETEWSPNNAAAQSVAVIQQKAAQSVSRHMDSGRTGVSSGDMFQSQGVWGEYHYSDGERDNSGDVDGYKVKINGITLGADVGFDSTQSGLAFTYGSSKVDTKGVDHSIEGDTYVGTVYSGWNYSGYFVDGMLSYGWGKSDYRRNGGLGSYKGEADHSFWSGRLVTGYNLQADQWVVQPQAELSYTRVKLDELKESEGYFTQKVEFSDYDIFELGAGVKAFGELDTGSGMLKPEVSLMGYHDFKDDKHTVNAVILNGNVPYMVPAGERDQNRFLFEAGLNFKAINNLDLGVSYNYNWTDNYKAHGANVTLRYDF